MPRSVLTSKPHGYRCKEDKLSSMEMYDGVYISEPDDSKNKSGIYCSRSQIAAGVVLALLLVTGVGLMAGILPQCEVAPAEPLNGTTVKPVKSELPGAPTTPRPATPTPCKEGPWCDLRLPKAIYPEHYKLLLYPDLDTGNFTGTVDIDIMVTESIKFPRIHIKEMIIKSSEIRPAAVSSSTLAAAPEVTRAFGYVPNQFYVMEMAAELTPGEYVWSLEFQGDLQPNRVGFYLSTYTNSDGDIR